MKSFKLFPYIKGELYQLKDIDNKNVYLEIKIHKTPSGFISGCTYKEYYSKGFFNEEQILEITDICMNKLVNFKYITEISFGLDKGD